MPKPAPSDADPRQAGRVRASRVRYIKLGAGGRWEAASLDQGRLDWGLPTDPHETALMGDWDRLRQHYQGLRTAPGSITADLTETQAFYVGDPDALWITFARGMMWWAFAEPEVHWVGGDGENEGTRYRRTRDGWHDSDLAGNPLRIDRLSSSLTQVAGYRRTICGVAEAAYCLRMINAEIDPGRVALETARQAVVEGIAKAITRLHWRDFELLFELILARSGWQRVSALGGMLRDVDLVVEQLFTGERMLVQVKSKAAQPVVDDYARRFASRTYAEKLLFVCHSPSGALREPVLADGRPMRLMTNPEIAQRASDCGLAGWVLDRAT